VKFYRRRFDEARPDAGIHPDLADLAKFPCTTREDLSENYPYGLFAVP
jgi:phenylacetate-CoA ligase